MSSPSRVWGEAPAAEQFGAYLSQAGDNTFMDLESKHLQFSGVSESVTQFCRQLARTTNN